jgi:hypothetical protein
MLHSAKSSKACKIINESDQAIVLQFDNAPSDGVASNTPLARNVNYDLRRANVNVDRLSVTCSAQPYELLEDLTPKTLRQSSNFESNARVLSFDVQMPQTHTKSISMEKPV